MAKPLIIVESPTKAKTLAKFLGRRYLVEASMGHVRDLPKSQLGVDVEDGFAPKYITIRGKGDVLKQLRKAKSKASKVLLATDPDREGEAISWHLASALALNDCERCRIEFHEITKEAVTAALKNPRPIDANLVNSQQARRVVDRLVGYNLSPLLWKKVRPGLSAGRVQSAALRLIVDREEEIEAFVRREYWSLTASLESGQHKEVLTAKYYQANGEKTEIVSEPEALAIVRATERLSWQVESVRKRERHRSPAAAFTTSTLQQEASRRLGYGARKTMSIAQQLYEGVDVGPGGAVGLVTYIRTDSTRVSAQARVEAVEYVRSKYGDPYVGPERAPDKRPNQQGAHEAIRPTSIERTPENIRQYLSTDQYKLYKLIWERFVASTMADAVYDTVSAEIQAGEYKFRATGSVRKFAGFMMIYVEASDEESKDDNDQSLPELEPGQQLSLRALEPKQHFTQPPPRYTEAALVKTLEERGIGRPSTYAPIIDTLQARGYVSRIERKFMPTELGKIVTTLLKEYFPDVVNVDFTAHMEERLDHIESGEVEWKHVVSGFYQQFKRTLDEAEQKIGGFELEDEQTDVQCDKCGRFMVKKHGRYGPFLACPGFPECRNTKPIVEELGVLCPECGGNIVVRKSKRGRVFYGCSNYPDCEFTSWNKPLPKKCPDCGALLVEKRARGKSTIVCLKQCGYRQQAEPEGEAE